MDRTPRLSYERAARAIRPPQLEISAIKGIKVAVLYLSPVENAGCHQARPRT
jgi:hypothetical protein